MALIAQTHWRVALFASAWVAAGTLWLGSAQANPGVLGQWSEVIDWPFIPTSAAQRADGRILTWASTEVDGFPVNALYTHAGTFDPRDGSFVSQPNPHHDMFCAGTAMLANGDVLAAGGNPTLTQTSRFDGLTWQVEAPMAQPRWYGTVVTLADSTAFATFGKGATTHGELWQENAGWTDLPRASMATLAREQNVANSVGGLATSAQWFGFMHLAPNGRVFHAGPTPTMNWFDTGGLGAVQSAGTRLGESRMRQFGNSVMFDEGQLLVTGGADQRESPASTASALTIDISGSAPVVDTVPDMVQPRTYHNSVVLPTGDVLVVGGNENGIQFSDDDSALTPEIWSPDSRQWRAMADHAVPRNYHSVAVLLKDGRVLSAGGGLCGENCPSNHADAEIFSPPYLFNADGSAAERPAISFVSPYTLAAGNVFVESDAELAAFNLVRLGSTTHSNNADQRFLSVAVADSGDGVYELAVHANPNVLVPGHWWLFAVDTAGVPSVGQTIEIGVGQAAADAPVVAGIPDQVMATGDDIAFDLTGFGSNNIQWRVAGLPPGLRLEDGVILGEPTSTGVYDVAAFAEADGRSARLSVTFDVVQGAGVAAAGGLATSGGAIALPGLLILVLGCAWRRRVAWYHRTL